MDGVIVVGICWVKPWVKLLFSASDTLCVDVGVDDVWLPGHVAKELKVYLIVLASSRRKLQKDTTNGGLDRSLHVLLHTKRSKRLIGI